MEIETKAEHPFWVVGQGWTPTGDLASDDLLRTLGGDIGGLLYTSDADGSLVYFHYDGQGNVVSITDEAREEIAYYEYDAWGNILTQCGSLANEFAFSTKQASTGTGLVDFGYRWYDPSTGRWTQRDPIGIEGGIALYAFCSNSPANLLDPRGLRGHREGDSCVGAFWEGFRDSIADQIESMSDAVFGKAAFLAYGVGDEYEPMPDQYEKSAWGQSEGTWAEIPTKVSIVTGAVAISTVVVCKVGVPLVRLLSRLRVARGFHPPHHYWKLPWLGKKHLYHAMLVIYFKGMHGCGIEIQVPMPERLWRILKTLSELIRKLTRVGLRPEWHDPLEGAMCLVQQEMGCLARIGHCFEGVSV